MHCETFSCLFSKKANAPGSGWEKAGGKGRGGEGVAWHFNLELTDAVL